LDDGFGWARRALNIPKRWFPARADVWKVQYAAPNVTDILDIDLHVAHDRLGELRALRGVTVTGVMIEDVTATLKEQVNPQNQPQAASKLIHLELNANISNSSNSNATSMQTGLEAHGGVGPRGLQGRRRRK
jgi:hypothetical protein